MDDELTSQVSRSIWWGWGDPARARPLPASAWSRLQDELGVGRDPSRRPVPDLDDVHLPPSRLTEPARAALVAAVGAAHVATARIDRIEHASGKSYPDLFRLRTGDGSHAPDAVVYPASADDVAGVLAAAAQHRFAVVPFGGGTSVVGGVDAAVRDERPVVTLDLRRMDAVVAVDPVSRTGTFQPGLRGPAVEAALEPWGLTLGHYPQSHQQATIGGYVATRSAGQASTGYGRIDELVLGARLTTPEGELHVGDRAPASAAGPGLLDLVVGSEGSLGVITEATLRLAPRPTVKSHAAWVVPGFAGGAAALRTMAQDLGHHVLPDVCRLSDPDETRIALALAGSRGRALTGYLRARRVEDPALLVLVWEGTDAADVRTRRRRCEAVLRRAGAVRLPGAVARSWEHGRFSGPYLRDELMTNGVLADTLETAASWSDLDGVYRAVRAAITDTLAGLGTPGVVQCHVSHVYPSGASLYFTFVARESADPLAQWRAVKTAASTAISTHGATISHHHAVGLDHRPYLTDEIGPLGVRVLRAVKAELDPHGVLNPGKLIPDTD